MNTILLLTLAASLSFNLLLKSQNRFLRRKNNGLFLTILKVICESKGSSRIDESTVRLFSYGQPEHKKAIELLIREGYATHRESSSASVDAVIEMRVA